MNWNDAILGAGLGATGLVLGIIVWGLWLEKRR